MAGKKEILLKKKNERNISSQEVLSYQLVDKYTLQVSSSISEENEGQGLSLGADAVDPPKHLRPLPPQGLEVLDPLPRGLWEALIFSKDNGFGLFQPAGSLLRKRISLGGGGLAGLLSLLELTSKGLLVLLQRSPRDGLPANLLAINQDFSILLFHRRQMISFFFFSFFFLCEK